MKTKKQPYLGKRIGKKNKGKNISSSKLEKSHEKKIWTCLGRGNFERKFESLLIAVQNNAIRTN